MTVQEAIKELQVGYLGDTEEIVQAKHMGIMALEKQIPKKPILVKKEDFKYYKCPSCGNPTLRPFCGDCGQKIDWEEGGTSD